MKKILIFMAVTTTAFTAFAGSAADSASFSSGSDEVLTPMPVLKVFFLLIVVIGLIVAALWVLKKISPPLHKGASSGMIKILSTNYIGPKRALLLIEILDRVLLVGVTESDIELITEFTDADEVNRLRAQAGKGSPGENFAATLSSFFKNKAVVNGTKQ